MLEPWQLFASVGLLLALAEFFTPTFFSLPAGLAFFATAIAALLTQNWTALCIILAINLAIVYASFQRFVWPRLHKTAAKTNADAMSGKVAVVTEAVDPLSGAGEAKLYGDSWRVISDQAFAVGEKVRIVATEGNKIVIAPLLQDEAKAPTH